VTYLLHLATPWAGIRHVLVIAKDELDLMEQFSRHAAAKIGSNYLESRIGRAMRNRAEWQLFCMLPMRLACSCCHDDGGAAA
jgi:hypothetical protein